MRSLHTRRGAAIGALTALSFVGAGVASATTPPTEPTDTTDSSMTEGTSATGDSTMAAPTEPSGPLCAAIEGESYSDGAATSDATATTDTMTTDTMSDMSMPSDTSMGDTTATGDSAPAAGGETMADSPVATAASLNPLLTTLVAAVTAAELGDTLNSGGPFTVLAPINSAFDKIPPADLEAALADPAGALTTVLTYHVIPEQLSSTDLVDGGTFATIQGEDVTFEMIGDTLVVNGGVAAVQCMDIPTANATVFLIDSVLAPPSMAGAEASASTESSTPTDSMGTMSPATTEG